MQTDKRSVVKFSNEPFADPDMDVYIKQSLIDRVLAQDRVLTKKMIKQELAAKDSGFAALHAAYNDACDSGEFRCAPHMTGLKIRMSILKLFDLRVAFARRATRSACCIGCWLLSYH